MHNYLRISLLFILTLSGIMASAQTVIPMEKEGDVFVMPCKVNGLKLRFILDTGASSVSISLTEAIFMIKNDYLEEDDLLGSEYYQIANGEIVEGTQIILREIQIGDKVLRNVKASITHSLDAPLLLGQSALSQMGQISLDYSRNTLTILDGGTSPESYSKPSASDPISELTSRGYQIISAWVNSRAVYQAPSGKMGILDREGNILGQTYDTVEDLANGFAVYHENGLRGYLDLQTGRVAIEAQYAVAWAFELNGRAKVKNLEGNIQYIDTNGDCVKGCKSDLVEKQHENALTFKSPTQKPDLIPFPKMIHIPSGTFQMGSYESDDEQPVHTVRISTFYLSETEVTFAQYDYFCEQTGRIKPDDAGWGRGNRPVINVNWDEAQAYCSWASQETGKRYRLPTEAEWEYTAGGGAYSRTKFAGTDSEWSLGDYAVHGQDYKSSNTRPVKTKTPNALGLYDMSGNVWEWCEDKWHDNYQGAPPNSSAWNSGSSSPPNSSAWNFGSSSIRVFRGGGWFDKAMNCRVAYRLRSGQMHNGVYLGFRLAMDNNSASN